MTDWILPSNPGYYRTDDEFREKGFIEWGQRRSITNIAVGDTVYIYISSPVQEIHWRCRVDKVNQFTSEPPSVEYYVQAEDRKRIEAGGKIGLYSNDPFIVLSAEYEFQCPDFLAYKLLRTNGLTNRVMTACRISPQLSQYLTSIEKLESDEERIEDHYQNLSQDQLLALAQKQSGKAKRIVRNGVTTYHRSRAVAEYAKSRANGHCQLCGNPAPFIKKNGEPYLESHHVVSLAKGGDDSIDNVVGLCPNCHRKMHILNIQSDVNALKKVCLNI